MVTEQKTPYYLNINKRTIMKLKEKKSLSTEQQMQGQTATISRSATLLPQHWPAQAVYINERKNAALNLPIIPQKRYCGNVNFHLAGFQMRAGKNALLTF